MCDCGDGSITVWADDTASVYLDGVLLVAANFGQAANCSPGPITCTGPGYVVDFTTSPGTHILQFDVHFLHRGVMVKL